jgi:hypothetical protein
VLPTDEGVDASVVVAVDFLIVPHSRFAIL